ncbi:hypothetical protein RRG08_023453 [Elysia crispata]|uniref:Uncharacterized protein n=1 Tax=Elysia crispata TaxID=231223 RepID=A0AAE1DX74_9GAST|nr:hypothetical protein RRG08_023453 [Elysia crispata]
MRGFTCPALEFHGGDKRAGLAVSEDDCNGCHREIHVLDFVLVCSGNLKIPSERRKRVNQILQRTIRSYGSRIQPTPNHRKKLPKRWVTTSGDKTSWFGSRGQKAISKAVKKRLWTRLLWILTLCRHWEDRAL